MVKAEKWGLTAMQQAGADKSWMQQCMVPHWVRGGEDKAGAIVDLGDGKRGLSLDVVALGNSIGSGPKGVTAQVVEVKSFEELELKKQNPYKKFDKIAEKIETILLCTILIG